MLAKFKSLPRNRQLAVGFVGLVLVIAVFAAIVSAFRPAPADNNPAIESAHSAEFDIAAPQEAALAAAPIAIQRQTAPDGYVVVTVSCAEGNPVTGMPEGWQIIGAKPWVEGIGDTFVPGVYPLPDEGCPKLSTPFVTNGTGAPILCDVGNRDEQTVEFFCKP